MEMYLKVSSSVMLTSMKGGVMGHWVLPEDVHVIMLGLGGRWVSPHVNMPYSIASTNQVTVEYYTYGNNESH